MLTVLALSLLACGEKETPPTATPPTTATAPQATAPEAPPPVSTADAYKEALKAKAGDIPVVEGKDYGGRYLVILNSSRTPGERPASMEALAAAALPEVKPVRLISSQFKGLMPCYEIIVAGGWASKGEAIAVAKKLKAAGVDNYVKASGEFVGDDPRVAAYCHGELDVSAECRGSARFVTNVQGKAAVLLGLSDVAVERALGRAPNLKPTDDARTQWTAPLGMDTVESWSKGAGIDLLHTDTGERRSCKVTGFAALVEGQPHFGWYDNADDKTAPGCGELQVAATLDCDLVPGGELAVLAVPAGTAAVLPVSEQTPSEAALAAAARSAGYLTWERQAQAGAKERQAELVTESEAIRWKAEGGGVTLSTTTWTTGEGYDACGGDDLRLVVTTAIDDAGNIVGQPLDATYARVVGVVKLDGRWMAVTREDFGGAALVALDGEEVCAADYAFCDCPC